MFWGSPQRAKFVFMHLKKGVGRGGVCKVCQCTCGFVCVVILFSSLYIGAKCVYTDTISSELVVPLPYIGLHSHLSL